MKNLPKSEIIAYVLLLALGILGPILAPNYTFQFAVLWIMVLFAQTWDTMGGQMGYNSLGNIFFFGIGMYTCAVVQVGFVYDVGEYTSHTGSFKAVFTEDQYYIGLANFQRGNFQAALKLWVVLEATLENKTPRRQFIQKRINKLAQRLNVDIQRLATLRDQARQDLNTNR